MFQKHLTDSVFVIIPGKCDCVDQSTDSVCSSNLPAPFHASQYPNGGVQRDEYGSMRLSPGHAHPWRWKHDLCRTDSTRTLRWKRAISCP